MRVFMKLSEWKYRGYDTLFLHVLLLFETHYFIVVSKLSYTQTSISRKRYATNIIMFITIFCLSTIRTITTTATNFSLLSVVLIISQSSEFRGKGLDIGVLLKEKRQRDTKKSENFSVVCWSRSLAIVLCHFILC